MTSKESIFISYRRSDSQDVVGRIDDYLTDHFGREHVFLDRNSIDYGTAFPDRLTQAMQDSKVVFVVIGSSWSSVQDEKGRQRLASPGDWVRQEVELALNQGLYVIPVVLSNTTMPSPSELPESLYNLLERNAFNLITRGHTEYFKTGMRQLIQLIEERVPELKPAPPVTLHPFEFEVFTVYLQAGLLGKKLISESQNKIAKQFIEDLGNGVYFEMVSILGGNFMMGAPAEEEALESERPQHCVTVPPFFMGKYAVTQRLWQTVTGFPKVERELDLNPSDFKGDQQPVETVSWFDAVEFCQRLSKKTGRNYRLPSEAEWEYACRAGTTTPFHLGETVTSEWVNCDGSEPYGDAPKSEDRQRTTDVGSFYANAFGLFDMHGNVWEWCADHWHDDYTNAPIDGSAWVTDGEFEHRLLRGGSWLRDPGCCRSASRLGDARDGRYYDVGFRIVCSIPRTL